VKELDLHMREGRNLVVRWLAPGKVSAKWNTWNLYRDIAWYGVLSGVSTTFTSIFALRLGASNFLIGLLTSLPALLNVVFQLPAARLIERQRNSKRTILVAGFLMRFPVFLVALVPFFFRRFQAEAVVYITALGTIPGAVSNVAFTAMLADVVPPQDRAHVVSVRNVLLSVVTTLAVIAAGKALDILPFPVSYQLIFLLAFLTSLLSLYYVGRIVIPDREPPRQEAVRSEHLDLRRSVQTILAQRDYVRFTVASFLYHWGLYFPIPLYAIYKVRTLHISEGWIGALAMLESGVTIVAYYIWGRLAEKHGSLFVLLLGLLGVCFYPIGTALSSNVWPLLLVSFVAGIAAPAFNLGLFNGLLEVTPAARRATYLAIFNTLMNIPAFVSPILGTTMAGSLGIRMALWIGGAARIAGFLAFAYLHGLHSSLPVTRFYRRARGGC